MRILHVHKYHYRRAGVAQYLFELMRMQEGAGHTTAVFSMHYPKNEPSIWEEYFVSQLETEDGFGRWLNPLKQLLRAVWSREAAKNMTKMIEDFKPDIIHAHNLYTHLSPSVLASCKKAGVPVVMTLHDYGLLSANYNAWDKRNMVPLLPETIGFIPTVRSRFVKGSLLATLGNELVVKWHLLLKNWQRPVSRFLAVSKQQREYFVQNGFGEEEVHLQYNFVAPHCRKRIPGKDLIFVGRLVPSKGIEVVIEAMRSFKDVKLQIFGHGESEKQLKNQAKGMKNIVFRGYVKPEELGRELSSARAAIFPSLGPEPFGLSLVEAMWCGVPAIVSNRGAFPEIVEDGISGLIFDPNQPETLVHAIKELVEKNAICEVLSEAGKERAREISDPEEHLQSIMKHYKEVIETVDN